MKTNSFDDALRASQQVATQLNVLRDKLEATKIEIKKREEEIELHQSTPLPESGLSRFLMEYVDTVAARGEKVLASHLNGSLHPERGSETLMTREVKPLTFSEIGEVLGSNGGPGAGWLVDNFPLPLPYLQLETSREVLTFLLIDEIKAGIAKLVEKNLVRYRKPNSSGLPLVARRARIADLEGELSALREEKAGIETDISSLKKGLS